MPSCSCVRGADWQEGGVTRWIRVGPCFPGLVRSQLEEHCGGCRKLHGLPAFQKHSTNMTTQTTTTPMADEPSTEIAAGDAAPDLVLRLRGSDGGGAGGADPIPAAPPSPASPAQEHAAATRFQAVVRGRLARARDHLRISSVQTGSPTRTAVPNTENNAIAPRSSPLAKNQSNESPHDFYHRRNGSRNMDRE